LITLRSSANVLAMVEPHCSALEGCAAAMEAAGIGGDPKNGHVTALRQMASRIRAEASNGKVPSIWRDNDYPTYAAADPKIIRHGGAR
jgi:hypothetical protein